MKKSNWLLVGEVCNKQLLLTQDVDSRACLYKASRTFEPARAKRAITSINAVLRYRSSGAINDHFPMHLMSYLDCSQCHRAFAHAD